MADRDPNPHEAWAEVCWKAEEYVKSASFEDAGNMAIEVAHEMLAIARQLKGVACCVCHGRGLITYSDTSTWRRGIGGSALTEDVCERCWGSGRADKTGPDLRRIAAIEKQNEHVHLKNKSLALGKIEALEKINEWKDASGLEKGGDPDGITPDDLRREMQHLRTTQEKQRGAADEALLAEHETEMARMVLVIEQFCSQCTDYEDDPGACPDCPLHSIGGGK